MFNITCCTRFTRELSCEFLIVTKIVLIPKSISKRMNYRLNSYTLSNKTLRRHWYLNSHVLLNDRLTLADELSTYSSLSKVTSLKSKVGTFSISKQTIADFTIVIWVILTLFLLIAPPSWCCLIGILYGPIRSTCIVSHVFSYTMFLVGRSP